MTMRAAKGAAYNEIEPFAAEWLRRLILADLIAPGDVDERSIEDILPSDYDGYVQCHFFAGIGIWSHALRQSGWDDERPIWTGSCPCQPFSAAGKGAGFDDERHLWPAWFWLIEQSRPDCILGEQVEGPAGDRWFDLVSDDLEAKGYTCGQVVFPAAGVGAPHIRHRRYWMAKSLRGGTEHRPREGMGAQAAPDSGDGGLPGERLRLGLESPASELANSLPAGRPEGWTGAGLGSASSSSSFGELGHHRRQGLPLRQVEADQRGTVRDQGPAVGATGALCAGTLEQPTSEQARLSGRSWEPGSPGGAVGITDSTRESTLNGVSKRPAIERAGSVGTEQSYWHNPDWIWCRDGKYRPVEPSTFPLATGYPSRVGRLRAYGNALCAPQAQAFIEAAMTCLP